MLWKNHLKDVLLYFSLFLSSNAVARANDETRHGMFLLLLLPVSRKWQQDFAVSQTQHPESDGAGPRDGNHKVDCDTGDLVAKHSN